MLPVPVGLMKLGGLLTGQSATVKRLVGSLAVDDRHIRETLEWTAPFTMQDGLRATAEWINSTGERRRAA